MTRTQIRLDTLSDVNGFIEEMLKIKEPVWLEDGSGIRVNARSMLGCLYSLEWTRIYCCCDKDINVHLMSWAI